MDVPHALMLLFPGFQIKAQAGRSGSNLCAGRFKFPENPHEVMAVKQVAAFFWTGGQIACLEKKKLQPAFHSIDKEGDWQMPEADLATCLPSCANSRTASA